MVKTSFGPPYKQEPLRLISSMAGPYLHIQAFGKLTYGLEAEAKERLTRMLGAQTGYILDLSGLKLIDSTGFGVLIYFKKKVDLQDGHVVLIVQDELQKELIAIAKLDRLFPLCSGLQEALERLKSMEPEA